jgi:hypothetical protein
MSGVTPSDRGYGARAQEPAVRRGSWFSRARPELRCDDQEAEVREQLYARPAPSERTVRRVQRLESPGRMADRPAA